MCESFRSMEDPEPEDPHFVESREVLQERQLKTREWVRLTFVFKPLHDHPYYRLAADLFCGGNLLDNSRPFPLYTLLRAGWMHETLPTGPIAAAVATFLSTAMEGLFPVDLRAHMLLMDPRSISGSQMDPQMLARYRDEGSALLYWVLDVPRGLHHEVLAQVRVLVNSRFKWSQIQAGGVDFACYAFELPRSLCSNVV